MESRLKWPLGDYAYCAIQGIIGAVWAVLLGHSYRQYLMGQHLGLDTRGQELQAQMAQVLLIEAIVIVILVLHGSLFHLVRSRKKLAQAAG